MTGPTQHERLHAMDALRAVAMLLGIALHGGLAYMTTVWPVWAADDASASPVFDVGFWVIHLFRMEVFFVMAGFFGCMLLARYGFRRFAWHRLKRIGLPLVIAMATVLPLTRVVWGWGLHVRWGDTSWMQPADAGSLGRLVSELLSPMHLWFLAQLLVLYAVAAVLHALAVRVRAFGLVAEGVTDAWAWVVRHGLAAVVFAVLAFPALLLQSGPGVDTQMGPLPPVSILLYYGVFFGGGWLLYRRRHDLERLGRFWIAGLVVGLVLSLVYIGMMGKLMEGSQSMTLVRAVGAVSTACLVVGFTGLFLRLFSRPSRVMRYVSDSAYWMYIIHLPLVVALNILLLPLGAPALVKFATVCVAAFAIMLVSYQLFVRYTWIGVLLNGTRVREERRRSLETAAAPA